MAAYPSIQISEGTGIAIWDTVDRTELPTGSVLLRDTTTAQQYAGQLSHKGITTANKSILETFYGANKLVSFTHAHEDGYSYTLKFTRRGCKAKHVDGDFWNVTSHVRGTRV